VFQFSGYPAPMDDVRRLLDRAEIADLLTRYTRAIDGGLLEGLDEVFTDDATIDYTASGGVAGPVAEVRQWLATDALPLMAQTQHLVGQVETVWDGDDAARVTAYFWNPVRIALPDAEPLDMEIGGLYEHDLVRTDAGWRSRRLVERVLWRR
jgi:hypothetical protein